MKRIISMILSVLMFFPSSAIVLADDEMGGDIEEIEVTEFAEDNVTEDNVTEDNVIEDNTTESDVVEDNTTDGAQNDSSENKNNINQIDELTPEVDVQEITGFGNLDVEDCESLSEEEEKELLYTIDNSLDTSIDIEQLQTLSDSGWQSCGTMTSERSYMSSIAFNDNIYTFGGTENGIVTDKTEYYNTLTQTWNAKADMPYGRYKHTAAVCNDKVYIGSGYGTYKQAVSEISVYDIANDTWLDAIQTPDNNTNYAFGVYDNELYIFSGEEDGRDTNKVYKYSFDTNNWTRLSDIPVKAMDGVAIATNRGFYIISNFSIYEYNVQYDEWTYVDQMAREVYDYAVVNRGNDLTNELYITGGRDEKNSGIATANTKYRYDTDSLSSVPNWQAEWYNDLRMIRGLACHNMVIANNNVYVFGGQVEYGEDQKLMFKRSLDDTKDDNPERSAWSSIIYGSINSLEDVDHYSFEPETDGYYEIVHLNPIQSNNLQYEFNINISESTGNLIIDGMYTNSFGAVYMQAGKKYYIDIFDIEKIHRGNYTYRINKIDDDAADYIDKSLDVQIEHDVDLSFAGRYDIDYVKFEIPDTGEYNIHITGQEPNIGEQYTYEDVKIYDKNEKEIYDFNTYFDSVFSCQLRAGTYYMSFTPLGFYYDKRTSDYTFNIHNTSKQYAMYNTRARHELINVDDTLYAIGGLNGSFNVLDSIEIYDNEADKWSSENISDNIKKDAAVVSVDERIYVIGGYNNGIYYNNVKSYNTETQTWRNEGVIDTARGRSTAITDGRYIYVIGGRNNSGYLDSIEVFDTSTALVSDTLQLPEALVDPQAVIYNSQMYVIGGIGYDGYSKKVYALENNKWVQKSDMPYASEYMRGTMYENYFVCAATNNKGNVDILKYMPSNDKWTIVVSDYIGDLTYYGVEVLDSKLFITGGNSYKENSVVRKTYPYDLVTDIASIDDTIPIRVIGYEYEQTNNANIANPPEITSVNARVIDKAKGIYELYLNEDDFECDARSVPFFFWSAKEGMFVGASEDFRRVLFYADPNTGDRQVKVIVGIGDGRGYVDKKAFLLDGNSEVE